MPVVGGRLDQISALSTLLGTYLRFAQGTIFLKRDPGLLHGRQGSVFVRIIEPAALPEGLIHMAGRHLGTTVTMERRAVARSGNMAPIHHGMSLRRMIRPRRQPTMRT